MLVDVIGAKCIGIEAVKVIVEVDIRAGLGIHLVGLADTAVKESLLRTVTSLQSLGYHIPGKKIVINLAPADLHKTGSGFDLPIALGIIAASGQKAFPHLGEYVIMGELGLDGSVRDVNGALPFAELAKNLGCRACILPAESALEATTLEGIDIFGVHTLEEAVSVLEEDKGVAPILSNSAGGLPDEDFSDAYMDFSDIIGQHAAKRGLEIAAAGGHNVIMVGPPGAGKSSLAKAMAGILPPMTREEALITSKIYSIAGKGDLRRGLIYSRPIRMPHYSASLPAILGGGAGDSIQPGEVSLAQGGILFLDEFGQIPNSIIQSLRAPVEDRKVVISRLRSKVEFPASFILVAASNPCPCGYWGEGDRCSCTPAQRSTYLSRLSGPIMDRIDLHLWLSTIPPEKMLNRKKEEPSSAVAERVIKAREAQEKRFESISIHTNAEMNNRLIEKYCRLSRECDEVMDKVIRKMGLSMRAFLRIIRVARTIADLEGSPDILPGHILEAAGYRFLDKTDV